MYVWADIHLKPLLQCLSLICIVCMLLYLHLSHKVYLFIKATLFTKDYI